MTRVLSHSRPLPLLALLLGVVLVLGAAPVAEAGGCKRSGGYRSGFSFSYSSGYSCGSRGHYGRRHYGSSHRHRHAYHRPSYRRSCGSGVRIRLGGSYRGSYGHGYGYRSVNSSYRSPSSCRSYTRPVVRTRTVYRPVIVVDRDHRPVYGTTYTTSSSDRYRDWQYATTVERTTLVDERPAEDLLPDTSQRVETVRVEEEPVPAFEENSEPPLGTGSTPTTADEEFQETERDEVSQAWDALIEGDAPKARALFADAARWTPKKGEARLGYVLASLRDGDRRAASISMVRLLETEPQLVRAGSLPNSTVIGDALARQGDTLKRYRDDDVKLYERRMLIAFVALLRGDVAEGQEAMRRARRAGAEGVAARNLWRLVGLSDKPLERIEQH